MNQKLRAYLRRDGWMLAALIVCAALCLLVGKLPSADVTEDEADRISRVLSQISGAGKVEVAVYCDADNMPSGAVVVAEGAASVSVRLQLTDAVATLLGIDPDCVAVYASERSVSP